MVDVKTANDTALDFERRYAAPQERVFRAWTDPAQIKSWWGKKNGFRLEDFVMELKQGGRFRMAMRSPENNLFVTSGRVREADAPRRVVYTWVWEEGDWKGIETLVTVDFRKDGDGTRVTVRHENFTDASARDRHLGGWATHSEGLEDYLNANT